MADEALQQRKLKQEELNGKLNSLSQKMMKMRNFKKKSLYKKLKKNLMK